MISVKKSYAFDPSLMPNAIGDYGDFYRREIANGISEFWVINDGESHAITRLEIDESDNGDGNIILVICCYEGRDLLSFIRHCEKIVDKRGWVARVHTNDERLLNYYITKAGLVIDEYVLKRPPKNKKGKDDGK